MIFTIVERFKVKHWKIFASRWNVERENEDLEFEHYSCEQNLILLFHENNSLAIVLSLKLDY